MTRETHRFDLIVRRVRGDDGDLVADLRRDVAEEFPARRAKLGLAVERRPSRGRRRTRCPNSAQRRRTRFGGARRRRARSVIERRNAQLAAAEPGGGVEQHHRVEAAGHGEQHSCVLAQPVLHSAENPRGRVAWAHARKT